jgi:hypothetical protein
MIKYFLTYLAGDDVSSAIGASFALKRSQGNARSRPCASNIRYGKHGYATGYREETEVNTAAIS